MAQLAANVRHLKAVLGAGTELGLVVKADAYGHGLLPISRVAVEAGAGWLAVATVPEGIAIREAGMRQPVLILSPILAQEAEQAVFYDLDVSLDQWEIVQALSEAAAAMQKQARIHVKVDTGLHRFGLTPNAVLAFLQNLNRIGNVQVVGLSQHFSNSGRDPRRTKEQHAAFEHVIQILSDHGLLPPMLHAANSAAALMRASSRYQLARVGLYAYGIDPYDLADGAIAPVLSWYARVMTVRDVPAGEGVSYASTHITSRPTRIATVGVGYGDGYPRALSNRGWVMIHGQRAPVIGLVCMDQVLVDVTDIPKVSVGDTAELLGVHIPAVELAAAIDTTPHELTTRIMSRVPRRYQYP